MKHLPLVFLCLLTNALSISAQEVIHHYETIIRAENSWRYFVGQSAPPSDWMTNEFNDAAWPIGPGGFGYGDDDDGTIIAETMSVFLRRDFEVADPDDFPIVILHADYDDGFVAYLNGEEIARANLGLTGTSVAYNQSADDFREAVLYQGGTPDAFMIEPSKLKAGTNTLAIQVNNENINSSDLSAAFFLSVGTPKTTYTYDVTPDWFTTPITDSHLPILSFNTLGQTIVNESRIKARFGIIDNGPNLINKLDDPFNDYDGWASIEIRGASSLMFPKKNYGFETQEENGDNRNESLLGMPKENDWILHGPYSDKSLMRNVLTFDFARKLGRYVTRTRYCALFINEEYRGVYVLMEKIKRDKNRVDIATLKPEDTSGDELTGGYIFQMDRDDPSTGIDGWASSYPPNSFFAYKDPSKDELNALQRNYLRTYVTEFENLMAGTNYIDTYDQYIDVDSYVDYWISTEISKHIDAYRLSFFMQKHKDSNGGKIHFGPLWDFNLAYGNFDFACDPGPEGWAYEFASSCGSPLAFWTEKLTSIPAVADAITCRWRSLRQDVYRTENFLAYIDSVQTYLGPEVNRNFERWKVLGNYVWPNAFVGDSYQAEIDFLKNWIEQRLSWMDDNMIGSCPVSSTSEIQNLSIKVFPNPFRETLFFQFDRSMPSDSQVRLFNVTGQLLFEKSIPKGSSSFTLAHLNMPEGLYIYQLTSESQAILFTGRIIKKE